MIKGVERQIDIELRPIEMVGARETDVEDLLHRCVAEPRELIEGDEVLRAAHEQPETVARDIGDLSGRSALSRPCGFHWRVSPPAGGQRWFAVNSCRNYARVRCGAPTRTSPRPPATGHARACAFPRARRNRTGKVLRGRLWGSRVEKDARGVRHNYVMPILARPRAWVCNALRHRKPEHSPVAPCSVCLLRCPTI